MYFILEYFLLAFYDERAHNILCNLVPGIWFTNAWRRKPLGWAFTLCYRHGNILLVLLGSASGYYEVEFRMALEACPFAAPTPRSLASD
jgi:hypothetical protein